jgi:alkanesulfonate monooxygenase SsuD/methylene tetrahydromethanopterin reductase-like flavin-dependent oxidoreductase (luciferase family)
LGRDAAPLAAPRFGVLLPAFGTTWGDAREIAARAEAAGYDDVWLPDHLLGIPDADTPVLEAWTTLTALACATDHVGLGTLVLSATFRAPRVLGKAAATLDGIAPGRLTLGLGAGWLREEHDAFGLPFPPHAERIARLVETVEAVRELAPGVRVLVGGASAAAQSVAARHADLWNAPGDRLDELPELAAAFRRRREEAGRRVGVVSRVGVLLGAAPGEAEARLARRSSPWTRVGLGRLGLVGDPETILARIGEHRRLGVEGFVLGFSPRDARGAALEAFAERVVAPAREATTDTREEDT